MGEKVEAAEKKAGGGGDAGQKKNDGEITAVFKIDLHCDGCAKKVKRSVKHLEGVSEVKTDSASNKLTVIGKVDPAVIKSKLEQKIKKKIEIVSSNPKKDGSSDKKPDEKVEKKMDEKAEKKADEKSEKKPNEKVEKKSDDKTEKKSEEKKEENKRPKESTAVLKMRLHCEGCIQKIRKALIKYKGISEITVDAQKDLITVKGAIEGKDVASFLKGKFSRSVELVPSKKEEPAAAVVSTAIANEKKEKEVVVGGSDKKKKEVVVGGGEKKEIDGKTTASSGGTKMEVNKMEYSGYSYTPSTFYYGDSAQSQYSYAMEAQPSYSDHHHHPYSFANSSGYYSNQNHHMHEDNYAPQMFSDENPNACSIM